MELQRTIKTRHAIIRQQQRGIPDIAIDLLLKYGVCESAPGGAFKWRFDKRGWKKVLKYFGPWPPNKLGQLRKTELVENECGTLITIQFAHGR